MKKRINIKMSFPSNILIDSTTNQTKSPKSSIALVEIDKLILKDENIQKSK